MAAVIDDNQTGSDTGGEPALVVAVRDATKAIDQIRDLLPFVTNNDELGDGICEFMALQTKVDATRHELVRAGANAGVAHTIGVRTMSQYVAARTGHSPKPVRLDTARNKWLRTFPILEAAFGDGDLTVGHIDFIRYQIENRRNWKDVRDQQDYFVEAAAELDFDEYKQSLLYWLVMIDPDGEEPKDQIASTRLSFRKGTGGRTHVTAEFDAITGAAIEKMIEHEANKLANTDAENGVIRTDGARRAAAAFALMTRGFQREDGTYPVPLVNVVMSMKVAEWARGELDNPTPWPNQTPVPVNYGDVDGRCELINGTPIHPFLALAATGLHKFDHPTIRRYVLDANSRILDYSTNARSFPEHMRTATHIQSRGKCETPGCDAPHHWLQTDHVDPQSKDGQTTLTNAQNQCAADNQAKTNTTGHTPHRDKPPTPRYQPKPPDSDDRTNGDRTSDTAHGDRSSGDPANGDPDNNSDADSDADR